MTVKPSIDPARLLEEQLAQASPDLLRELLTIFINTLMSAESDAVCGAAYGTTGFFSVVGIVIAAALARWSARPAERFVRTTVSLTAISMVPPLLSGANTATTTALLGLHLVAATVMIPTLARSLRARTD